MADQERAASCPRCGGSGEVYARVSQPLNIGRVVGKVVDISVRAALLREQIIKVPCPECRDAEIAGHREARDA